MIQKRVSMPVWLCVALGLLVLLGTTAHGQCVSTATDPCIQVHQSTIDRAAKAADELLAARDAIAEFKKERATNEVERAAVQKLVDGLNTLIATKDRIELEQNKIIDLYKQVVEMQQQIIEKLEKQLGRGKTGWQKFAATLEKIALVLAGAALRGAL